MEEYLSFQRARVLTVVICGLHLQDVWNDAVYGDIPYESGKEELLCDVGVHQA